MIISHFQFKETKGKDYFKKAWNFSFIVQGRQYSGTYHQDGSIEWSNIYDELNKDLIVKELHDLMAFHVYK